jgi:hypothetical protein
VECGHWRHRSASDTARFTVVHTAGDACGNHTLGAPASVAIAGHDEVMFDDRADGEREHHVTSRADANA